MENILWVEEIVESKPAPQFLTNSRIDIAGFVNSHKVVVSGNAFLVVQVHQIQVNPKKNKKNKKTWKKARRPKVNLILLHVNHTFLY
jgi:hypothetical protein